MAAIGKDKYLWISNVLPMSIVDELGLSVAGKKMELSLIERIGKNIDVDVLSVSVQGYSQSCKNGFELWEGKTYEHLPYPSCKHMRANARYEQDISNFLKRWCKKFSECDKTVIVVNSPLFICRPLLKLKKKYPLKLYSLTVDLPRLEKSRSFKHFLLNCYNKYYFAAGHRSLRGFDGLIGVNSNVKKALGLSIPFHKMFIGIDNANECPINSVSLEKPYKVAFAGTFIDYNGIEELMQAVVSLDAEKYELHIFGYGPLCHKVEEYAEKFDNIQFHGQIPNSEMLPRLSQMDILVNPRVVNVDISDYTFPSKIVEYLATGKAVISTRFSAMPQEYENFAFIIDQATPEAIAQKLEEISNMSCDELSERCLASQAFIKDNHSYDKIAKEIIDFIKSFKYSQRV